jgi:hypothetical protein
MMNMIKHILNKESTYEVTLKTYEEVQEELHVFLTIEVASCIIWCTFAERDPARGLGVLRHSLDVVEK